MKQAEDNKTIDLMGSEKRGRGRPAKPDALSGAERAKRFRDARRGKAKAVTENVTENVTETVTKNEFKELQRAEQSRTLALASAHAEIRVLTAKLAEKEAEIAALKSRRKASKK